MKTHVCYWAERRHGLQIREDRRVFDVYEKVDDEEHVAIRAECPAVWGVDFPEQNIEHMIKPPKVRVSFWMSRTKGISTCLLLVQTLTESEQHQG